MNKSKKITLAAAGIAASVGIASVLCLGLGSLIALPWRQEPQKDDLIIHCQPNALGQTKEEIKALQEQYEKALRNSKKAKKGNKGTQ